MTKQSSRFRTTIRLKDHH